MKTPIQLNLPPLPQQGQQPAEPRVALGDINPNPLVNFGKSALSSMGELFGAEPMSGVEAWRARNPTGGLVSELVGIPVPYLGWYGATSKIPKFAKIIENANDASRPGLSAAKREIIRFAPFEAGRVGISTVTGDNTAEVATQAAFNLAAGGLIAGGLGKLASGTSLVPEAKKPLLPGVDELDAPQNIFRLYTEAVHRGELDPAQTEVKATFNRLRSSILGAPAPKNKDGNQVFVWGNLASGEEPKTLNRLFRGKNTKPLFAGQAGSFASSDARIAFEKSAELFPGWEGYAQFPRIINYNGMKQDTVRGIEKALQKEISPVGNFGMAKEKDTGMFVMTRLVGDKRIIFKTHDPRPFVPAAAKFADMQIDSNIYKMGIRSHEPIGVEMYDAGVNYVKTASAIHYRGVLDKVKSKQGFTSAIMEQTGMSKVVGPAKDHFKAFIDNYIAPTMFQFRDSPLAGTILAGSRMLNDRATMLAQRLLYGNISYPKGSSLYSLMNPLHSPDVSGGLIPKVRELARGGDFDEFVEWAHVQAMSLDDAINAGLGNPKIISVMKEHDDVFRKLVDEHNMIATATGNKKLNFLEGHYGISRTWRGDFRQAIVGPNGKTVWMVGGENPKVVQAETEKILESLGEGFEGQNIFLADRGNDLFQLSKVNVKDPNYEAARQAHVDYMRQVGLGNYGKTRTGQEGYKGQDRPMTIKEYEQTVSATARRITARMSRMSRGQLFASDLLNLGSTDPMAFKRLTERLNDLDGIHSAFAQGQNKLTDQLLAPIIGKDSATKITRVANGLMYHFQLGAGNLNFPIVNVMSMLQTTLPQLSFIMNAPPASLAPYYSTLPAQGANGLIKGAMSFLNPIKFTAKSLGAMAKPSPELWKHTIRASDEGVVDPRMLEEFMGEQARTLRGFKEAYKDGQWTDFMSAVSSALPTASEKFARIQSFTAGWLTGKDFYGLEGEDLYTFAKQFTNNTQFLYSTVDRARMITGPVGSIFGLFKNWQMHYMSQMAQYAGLAAKGVKEGNFGYMQPLLWQMAGTGAVAGVGGMPLVWAADSMSRWATDESIMTNIYDAFGDNTLASDVVYMGLPAALGVSFQGSGSAPDPVRDASMLFSFVHLDRAQALGRAAGTMIDRWGDTGEHPVDSKLVRDQLVRALAPRSIYRAFAATEDRAIRSLNTGNPMISDLSYKDWFLYAAGINPTSVELSFKVYDELWKDQERMKNGIAGYGAAIAEAMVVKDWKAVNYLAIRGTAEGYPMDSIMNSAKTRYSNQVAGSGLQKFDEAKVYEYYQNNILRTK